MKFNEYLKNSNNIILLRTLKNEYLLLNKHKETFKDKRDFLFLMNDLWCIILNNIVTKNEYETTLKNILKYIDIIQIDLNKKDYLYKKINIIKK